MDSQENPQNRTTKQVMDVRPPDSSNQSPESETPQVSREPVASFTGSEPTRPADTAPVPAPSLEPEEVTSAGAKDTDAARQQPNGENLDSAQQASEPETNTNVGEQKLQTDKRVGNGKPMRMIVLVLLVGIGLAGLSVYAYMATNKADAPAVETGTSTPQTGQQEVAPDVTVDSAVQEIDQALNQLDSEADFADSDLTDETIGL